MFPSPSFAPDAQLGQMAQTGLPSAVNEAEMRAALRRGAQVNPQPMGGPMPKRKLTADEMIKDFVDRVRMENEQSKNSLVPMGTPMPQPQPQQPQGIAGFQSGGVFGVPPILDPRSRVAQARHPVRPAQPAWLDRNSRTNPEGFVEADGPPPDLSWMEDNLKGPDLSWLNDSLTEKPFTGMPPMPVLPGDGSASGAVGVNLGGIKGPPAREPPKFQGFETVDPLAAGDKAIEAGRDKISALTAPFDELKDAYGKDVERTERNKIFDALIQGGIAMMQGGSASFDPASGDLMGILGSGAQAYASSLMNSENRISELREKIATASGKAAEVGFNAESVLHARGMGAAQHQNTMAANLAQLKTMHSGNVMDFIIAGDQMALQKEIAEFDAKARVAAAEIEGSGEGSKALLEIFKQGNEAYLKQFDPATVAGLSQEERAMLATKAANDRKQVIASGLTMVLGYPPDQARAISENLNNRLVMREDTVLDPKNPGKTGKAFNYPEPPKAPMAPGIDADGMVNLDYQNLFVPGMYPGS